MKYLRSKRPAVSALCPRVAFVFSGGANLGAVQAGQALALLEAGIRPDVIIGCSVGALNGAYLAADPSVERARELVEIWHNLRREDVFGGSRRKRLQNLVLRRDHLYEPAGLRSLIQELIRGSDGSAVLRLEDLSVPLHVVTTDLDGGGETWWEEGDLTEILTASACLPGVFPPVVLGGRRHVDGGVVAPVPVHRAVLLGAGTTYVLDVADRSRTPGEHLSALDVLVRSFNISRYAHLAQTTPGEGERILRLPAVETLAEGIHDFSRSRDMTRAGYDSAREYLARAREERASSEEQRGRLRRLRGGVRLPTQRVSGESFLSA